MHNIQSAYNLESGCTPSSANLQQLILVVGFIPGRSLPWYYKFLRRSYNPDILYPNFSSQIKTLTRSGLLYSYRGLGLCRNRTSHTTIYDLTELGYDSFEYITQSRSLFRDKLLDELSLTSAPSSHVSLLSSVF